MNTAAIVVENLPLEGAFIIRPKEFYDERGAFIKTYDRATLKIRGIEPIFVEDFYSVSKKGIIRGLHYQIEPFAQAKLVRCNRGKVFDVLVDLRRSSRTFGRWFSIELSEENKLSVYIPRGFAHGFLSMVDDSVVSYKVDNDYSIQHERGIIWSDRNLDIKWPQMDSYIISQKDSFFPLFENADVFD